MKVRAHITMVMNLDKCIGCHTCSVTCKNVWTNRPGAEYIWFNNVETKPGEGYPRQWENQDKYKGGWVLDKKGKPVLRSGGKLKKLANIFFNPNLPTIDDYYEPWTYDYETLQNAPVSKHQPVATPQSKLTGKDMAVEWGPNWEDDLAGGANVLLNDPNIRGELEEKLKADFENVFMMYLPRICNHCINTTCMASCPSGSIYKREEDGIVLIDQDSCRGWRMCVSGCPYKKVFFNWKSGKAEKCTMCFPRIEAGQPTVCSETCVGRIRYMGVLLYDADRIEEVAGTADEKDLIDAQLSMILDPNDPEVQDAALRDGVQPEWIEAARKSPAFALIKRYGVAVPLHPEFRTIPMVWYVPPLSPITSAFEAEDSPADPDDVFPAIESLRIPIEYLANMFTAGDTERIRMILRKLAAMRMYMRENDMIDDDERRETDMAGMDDAQIRRLYEILAIAKSKDRFVIPTRRGEVGRSPFQVQGGSGFPISFETPPEALDGPGGATSNSGFELPMVQLHGVSPGAPGAPGNGSAGNGSNGNGDGRAASAQDGSAGTKGGAS
ncbi:MAG: nitrate reductase subunit beta [Actinobacteria bacterium]|nr:nitrate reductase subunit beta [Actinomycetota bacterium]